MQTQFSLTMNGTCKADIKTLQADYVQTCKELLCPGNQYWDFQLVSCVVNPNLVGSVTPLPATIRGCELIKQGSIHVVLVMVYEIRLLKQNNCLLSHASCPHSLQSTNLAGLVANTKAPLTRTSVSEWFGSRSDI